jgi:glutamyl-tRNA synthetase
MGGVRTALYNYLYARKHKGDFVLRIEDTDQERAIDEAEDYIREALQWCGLDPDESPWEDGDFGPYRQSERKESYRQYVDQLIESGHAYYAFDTEEELEQMREDMKKQNIPNPQYNAVTRSYMNNSLTLPQDEVEKRLERGDEHVVRIKVPRKEEIKVEDAIRGWVKFHSSELDDKVLLKSDGWPTYHMANVVDDHSMEISHVIRGEEWLPSTPIHVLLYRYLGWEDEMPKFAHLPLILRPDGKGKLSKRAAEKGGFPVYPLKWKDPETGETNEGYREKGFFPEAFINMLAFLGWNPGTEQEIFTPEALTEAFSLDRVGKAGAKFSYDKAKWFNAEHLKRKDNTELAERFRPIIEEKGYEYDKAFVEKVCGLIKERAALVSEFWENGFFFFERPTEYDEKTIEKKWKSDTPDLLNRVKEKIGDIEPFTAEKVQENLNAYFDENDIGKGKILPVLRLSLSGAPHGPPIFGIIALLGKEECQTRIEQAIEKIEPVAQS